MLPYESVETCEVYWPTLQQKFSKENRAAIESFFLKRFESQLLYACKVHYSKKNNRLEAIPHTLNL